MCYMRTFALTDGVERRLDSMGFLHFRLPCWFQAGRLMVWR